MKIKYIKDAVVVSVFVAIFGVCFAFVKTVHDDAKEAERIVAINEIIHCGVTKMSAKAKEYVADAEHRRRMAKLSGDERGAVAAEASTRPIFAVLVDSCAPVDREQRREAMGWFKYSLEHDAEYRAISAPLNARYQRALQAKESGVSATNKDEEKQHKHVAWIFRN